MSIEVPSEKTSNIDSNDNEFETRLTAQDMLWNRCNSMGYSGGESIEYGKLSPPRAQGGSFAGFHDLNRINPIYDTTQNPSPEDSPPSSPLEQ